MQVENTLFKVPRAIFEGSPVFAEMFKIPQGGTPDGSSDEQPLELQLKAEEFRLFTQAATCQSVLLRLVDFVFSHMHLTSSQLGGIAQMPISDWKDVLRVADMWALDGLRQATIAQLEKMFTDTDMAWKLRLSVDYGIASWTHHAVERLVTRAASVSASDVDIMGADMVGRVLKIRDFNIRLSATSFSATNGFAAANPIGRMIKEAFPLAAQK
jgi:hypothetical protein